MRNIARRLFAEEPVVLDVDDGYIGFNEYRNNLSFQPGGQNTRPVARRLFTEDQEENNAEVSHIERNRPINNLSSQRIEENARVGAVQTRNIEIERQVSDWNIMFWHSDDQEELGFNQNIDYHHTEIEDPVRDWDIDEYEILGTESEDDYSDQEVPDFNQDIFGNNQDHVVPRDQNVYPFLPIGQHRQFEDALANASQWINNVALPLPNISVFDNQALMNGEFTNQEIELSGEMGFLSS